MGRKQNVSVLIKEWKETELKEALVHQKERKDRFQTEAGIPIERLYTPIDMEKTRFDYLKDLGFPGQYPFTRGRDPLGYRGIFWIFQQYAGYGDAEEANKRYRFLLDRGQTGISSSSGGRKRLSGAGGSSYRLPR